MLQAVHRVTIFNLITFFSLRLSCQFFRRAHLLLSQSLSLNFTFTQYLPQNWSHKSCILKLFTSLKSPTLWRTYLSLTIVHNEWLVTSYILSLTVGSCCDFDTCSLRLKSTPCRQLRDEECDLEEYCDGTSEWCPSDTYKIDGTPCYNRGDAYCYSGKCSSHGSQCHVVWGEGANNSLDICYTTLNGKGESEKSST